MLTVPVKERREGFSPVCFLGSLSRWGPGKERFADDCVDSRSTEVWLRLVRWGWAPLYCPCWAPAGCFPPDETAEARNSDSPPAGQSLTSYTSLQDPSEKIRFHYQPCDNTAYQGHSSENDVNSILNHLTRNLRLKNSNQAQVFLRLTPSISSITSFSVGAAEGERKPELSMTQVDTLGSPDVSASLPGFFWALGVLGDAVLVGALLAFSCTSGSYKWQ